MKKITRKIFRSKSYFEKNNRMVEVFHIFLFLFSSSNENALLSFTIRQSSLLDENKNRKINRRKTSTFQNNIVIGRF
jgi:hypothetical protein